MEIGQHLVFFYFETAEFWELIERMADLTEEGAKLLVTDAPIFEEGEDHFVAWGGRYVPAASLGFRTNPIRIESIIYLLTDLIDLTLENAAQLTLYIDMSWVIRSPSGIVYLREYEASLDVLTARYPALTIVCLYNRHIMPDQVLLNGLHTHRAILTLDGPRPNPHFVPPEIYQQRSLKPQIDYWLGRFFPASPPPDSPPLTGPKPVYAIETLSNLTAIDAEEQRWKIRLFGHMRVYREHGELIEWNVVSGATKKSRTLFAYLLFKGEAGASAEEIADLLWPDTESYDKSLNRLYHTIRCVRKALSPNLAESRKSPLLLSENQHYFLALPEHSWIDMPLFQEQCYRGESLEKSGRFDEALTVYRSAERLYTGELLADIPLLYIDNQENDWCWSRRYWFREMYLKMMVNSARLLRQTGQVGDGLLTVDKVLRLDPISAPANLEKMRLLQAAGRQDALRRQYRLYRDTLKKREMGEPEREIKQIYQSSKK